MKTRVGEAWGLGDIRDEERPGMDGQLPMLCPSVRGVGVTVGVVGSELDAVSARRRKKRGGHDADRSRRRTRWRSRVLMW